MSQDETFMNRLVMVNGRHYLPVADRIVELRRHFPNARIVTKMEERSDSHCIFKASIYTNDGDGYADGFGVALSADSLRHIETAETRAIGRALAMLGIGTLYADQLGEELDGTTAPQSERIVDQETGEISERIAPPDTPQQSMPQAPKQAQRDTAPQSNAQNANKPTDKQWDFLEKLQKRLKMNDEQLRGFAINTLHTKLDDMNRKQFSDLLNAMTKKADEAKNQPTPKVDAEKEPVNAPPYNPEWDSDVPF